MKKKLLITFIVVAMLVCVLAACGGGNKTPECTHNWEDTSTTATCLEAGETLQTCSLCGDTQTIAAAALGHTMERFETIKATCIAGGYDIYKCTHEGCDATEERNKTSQDFSPSAHNYEPDVKEPTCTKAGYTDNICTLCGSGDGNRETIPALKHTYERADYDGTTGMSRVEPQCEIAGSITYACQDCNNTVTYSYEDLVKDGKTELAESIKALEHNMIANTEKTTAPTCLEVGSNWLICANGCGKEEQVADTPALGHTYEREDVGTADYNYIVTDEPTCINIGYKWVVCDDCDWCTKNDDEPNVDAYRLDVAATGNHIFDVKGATTAPTCTVDGYTTYHCSVDGACVAFENRDPVAALDHDWVLTEELLDDGVPTCKTNGDYPYHCSRCDAKSINENGETNTGAVHEGYTPGVFTNGVAPTCVSRGKYFCTDCETVFDAYADDTLADADLSRHVFDVKEETIAPTCSTYGYTTYSCSLDKACTYTQDRDYTARTAHTFYDRSEDGTIVCMECSETYIDSTTIIATDSKELCNHSEGETCETCGIGVIITGTKTPDPAYELVAGTAKEVAFLKGAALIELKGAAGTTYTIAVYDKDGNQITTYDVVDDGTDIGKINVVTTAEGTTYVDLTEIETSIAKIVVTAAADAEAIFYVTEANVTTQTITPKV